MKTKTTDIYSLVEKYNIPGPRYTSYPTALHFKEAENNHRLKHYFETRSKIPRSISLYFHIPFCFSLCWYCGCTKIITKDREKGEVYLDYIKKEAELVRRTLHPESPVKQIHFGGGTPTFLTPVQLQRLGQIIQDQFFVHPEVEFSVEIDPRTCSEEHIIALKKIGVNRASLGVQDTNEEVQQAIHRIQPFTQTENVTKNLRKHSIENINLDLIYGLPRQNRNTFRQSLDQVLMLQPNRLAIYSYAHVPSLMPTQKLLKEEEFPSAGEKISMLVDTVERLPDEGYRFIGMDHFARENDELSRALDDGSLQRNFQGYSTLAELEMIALGMSGISMGNDFYYQNTKNLAEYYDWLDSDRLPVKKIVSLTKEDLLRRNIIMKIMCRGEINYKDFFNETGINFENTFVKELTYITELEEDELLIHDQTGFSVTDTGRLFLRNVAMIFDGYREQSNPSKSYSKTV
ncbi:MAG: oxygen-independent coproporphyrinogen III oxidase [Balneolaceae bacterium]